MTTLCVLIVDNSSDTRTQLRAALQTASVDYVFAESGDIHESLRLLQERAFDAVVIGPIPTDGASPLLQDAERLGLKSPAIIATTRDVEPKHHELKLGAHECFHLDELTGLNLHRAIQRALVRQRYVSGLRRRAAHQEQLAAVTTLLSRQYRLAEIFQCIMEHAAGFLAAVGGSLFTLADDGHSLQQLHRVGAHPSTIEQLARLVPTETHIPECSAYQGQELVICRSRQALQATYPLLLKLEPDTAAALAAPCFEAGHITAVLGLRFNAELSPQTSELAASFAHVATDALRRGLLYEQLHQQTLFEQRLLAVVSHDLRTPLGTLGAGLDLLHEHPDALREVVPRMYRAVSRMDHILGDLVELSRARSGQLLRDTIFSSLDLRDVLVDTANEYRTTDSDTRLILPGAPVWVRGTRERLVQVFDNLLSNAIKYGDAMRPVTLGVESQGPFVNAYVHNWGTPIPNDTLQGLFKPFTGDRRGKRHGDSLGLGLYIVREITEAHHGRVEVSSTLEEGTKFTLWFPRAEESAS